MPIENPCIRNCCLNEKDVCMGCFRHIDEILSWQKMSECQKQSTLSLCADRKEQLKQNAKTDFNRR